VDGDPVREKDPIAAHVQVVNKLLAVVLDRFDVSGETTSLDGPIGQIVVAGKVDKPGAGISSGTEIGGLDEELEAALVAR
jgi:hypothetical protein